MTPDGRIVCVIPSRGRADTITRDTLALMPWAYVSVDEREVDDYAEVVSRERILPHPTMSMIAIHNWLHDWHRNESGAEVMYVAYDDLINVRSLVGWSVRTYKDPEFIGQLLEVLAVCAKDAGSPMFGFGHHQAKPFYPHLKPFRLNGYVRNVIGFHRDFDLKWDPFCRLHGDVDLALQALQKYRFIYRDERFVWTDTPLGSNKGGQVGRRSKEQMAEADRKLIEKWGNRYVRIQTRRGVDVGDDLTRTQSTVINVPRRDFALAG